MKFSVIVGVITLLVLTSGNVSACSIPDPPRFEAVAPTAERIFVFQVLTLQYHIDGDAPPYEEWVEGKIRVVENFRGDATEMSVVHFTNRWCGGLRLDVGHSYLVATNITSNPLRFELGDQTVRDISMEYNPSWPEPLRTSAVLKRLLLALNGEESYANVLGEQYLALTRPLPE
jgi:hypothetical protein